MKSVKGQLKQGCQQNIQVVQQEHLVSCCSLKTHSENLCRGFKADVNVLGMEGMFGEISSNRKLVICSHRNSLGQSKSIADVPPQEYGCFALWVQKTVLAMALVLSWLQLVLTQPTRFSCQKKCPNITM